MKTPDVEQRFYEFVLDIALNSLKVGEAIFPRLMHLR
jgi:hypothetical protein